MDDTNDAIDDATGSAAKSANTLRRIAQVRDVTGRKRPVSDTTFSPPKVEQQQRNITHRFLAGQYHLGGQVESDAPAMAAARRQYAQIQRDHRQQRREGEEPSQTPTMSALADFKAGVEQYADDQSRPIRPAQIEVQLPALAAGRPLLPAQPLPELQAAAPAAPRRRGRPPGTRNRAPHKSAPPADPPIPRPLGRPPKERRPVGRPRKGPPVLPAREFDVPPPAFSGNLQESPLCKEDAAIREEFNARLASEQMGFCTRCKERWFDVEPLEDGVCRRCHRKDDKKQLDEPCLYSAANNLDFGSTPEHLPDLLPAEEMVIARVHVSVNVFSVRGQQFKYRGHVVHFLRDVGKIFTELPLLPADLDVIILRPPKSEQTPQMNRQFRSRFRIRRRVVLQWLRFLWQNHPGYSDMVLKEDHLSQLPEDGSVFDQLTIQEFEDLGGIPADVGPMEEDAPDEDADAYDEAAVPNLLVNNSELELLRGSVEGGQITAPERPPLVRQQPKDAHHLPMPSIRQTPLDEFNRSQCLLSLACPSLYPRGLADFAHPRQREITYQEYLEHAMRWEDGRFARHHTFRYIALNTLMRQQARGHSKFYVRKENGHAMTRSELQEALTDTDRPEAQAILNRITRLAGVIKGTRPFWYRKRRECEAFAYNLGVPGAFITLSPADLHWHSLYQHMPDFERWKSADEKARMALSRRLLRENPHIAAWHFHTRSTAFREVVLRQKFNLEDWWYRYEWQGRGSSHCHGLYWLRGSPAPDMSTPESQAEFARVWGFQVSAQNPEPVRIGQGGDGGNPLNMEPSQEQLTWQWLSSIVNRCQRHHCSTSYCLRQNKKAAEQAEADNLPAPEPQCRFHFPHELLADARMIRPPGRSYWVFTGKRNDAYMNQFSPLISICWRANTDISPCTGVEAVINYAAKYCSKTESQTSTYAQIARGILPHVSNQNPMLSFVSKMMNKLIGERDYSAQEVSHLLLGLPVQEDSRVVRSVDCRPQDRHTCPLDLADGAAPEETKTPYEKYVGRPEGLEGVSYFAFLERYNFAPRDPARWKEMQYPAKPRVLLYFPRYKSKPGHEQFKDFCRVKLTLNHPHRQREELLARDNDHCFCSYVEAYQFCREHHWHPDDHYGKVDEPDAQPDPDEFVPQPFQETPVLEDWQEVARMLPDALPEEEPADVLTRRDIDVNYDWQPHVGRYSHDSFATGRYWEEMKASGEQTTTLEVIPWRASLTLNPGQQAVYNTFMGHQLSGDKVPLRVQVDGGGGTGKSFMVKILSAHLHRQAARLADRPLAQVKSPVLRGAPTGVASNQINGQTLHSLLRLPTDGNFRPLRDQPAVLSNLQRVFQEVRYLVIDEKSMLGLKTLGWIDQRLREIFPRRKDEFFGGLSVLMIGDFFQLPPVLQKPLYVAGADASLREDELYGLNAYLSFSRSIFLMTIQRQAGDDQAAFRQALLELRECRVSEVSWELLSSRCAVRLSQAERDSFRDAARIYPTKARVNRYNHDYMVDLNSPAIYVSAINEGTGAEKAESNHAGNLSSRFPVCLGCRVMLTRNLWSEVGLVNGAQGRVYDIGWAEGANPALDPPCVILVVFDKYTGPAFRLESGETCRDGQGRLAVPILQVRQDFTYRNNTCTREQFPLVVSYAITVHKSQGVTLGKAVCDISEVEFAAGLSYVAVSRISTLQGLMFDSPFPRNRVFRDPPGRTMQLKINDYIRRQGELLSQQRYPPPPDYSDEESEASDEERNKERDEGYGSEGYKSESSKSDADENDEVT